MKIELKKLKHSPAHSEETYAFIAGLYINGTHVANCKNSGIGGPTHLYPAPGSIAILKEADKYCKKNSNKYCKHKLSLIDFIDQLVEDDLNAKQTNKILKRLDKLCIGNIVVLSKAEYDAFMNYGGDELNPRLFKYSVPLANIPAKVIKEQLHQIKAKLTGDEFIYNTNLPITF